MNVKIEPELCASDVEGPKRCYMPFVVKWTCDGCGKACELDLTEDYVSHPRFGPHGDDLTLWCEGCDHEGEIQVVYGMTMRPAD